MADGDFYSKHSGEEIEKILDGAVLYNEFQKLSEIQKAQARRNIGAGTVDSGVVIKGYYADYAALIAAQTAPQKSDAYMVGTSAPYDLYIWDDIGKQWINNGAITKGEKGDKGEDGSNGDVLTAESIAAALGYTPAAVDFSNAQLTGVRLIFTSISVPASSFADNSTYADFPQKATITLNGVSESFIPEVIFSGEDAMSGNFLPVAETYDGGVYIYAAKAPENGVTIPTIICWR